MNESLAQGSEHMGYGQDDAWAPPFLLRQAREAAGLHIAALAAALKVPVKKLEALESGRYDELPDLTFARALASSACRQLKTDPAPILDQIPLGRQPALGDSMQSINTPFKGDQGAGTGLSPMDLLRRPAVLVSLLAVLGALVVGLMPDWSELPGKEWMASVTQAIEGEPAGRTVTVEVQPTAGSDLPQVDAASVPVEAQAVEPTPVPAATEVSASAASDAVSNAAAAQTAPSSVLNLEAVGDSWVEVVDGTGKVQVQRMLRAGDVLDFSSAPPYAVVIGRADTVKVHVRGRVFDVTPYARNSVARFEVK